MAKKKNDALIVHRLHVKNVGPLKEVEIVPEGDVVELTGPNGSGKSSVLDSISYALSGAKAFKDVPQVTRDGEGEAEIVVDLGDYVVTRNWTDEQHYYLKVVRKVDDEELEIKAPQAVLDAFGKTIGTDPLALADKRAAQDRKDFLLSFVDIDLDELEEKRKQLIQERRDVGRDKKQAEGYLASLEDVPEEAPEPIDVAEVQKELQKVQEHNHQVERSLEKADELDQDIDDLEEEIKALQEKLEGKKQRREEATKWLNKNSLKDPKPLQEQIQKASQVQAQIQKYQDVQERNKTIEKLGQQYQEYSNKLEDLEVEKEQAIQEAKLPLEGLGVTEDDVTIDGQPFSMYSEGERLKYAALMLIGSDPRFKVLGVREGEKLDRKNRKILEDVARQHGFQLWLEIMDESEEIGLVLKAGEIVKKNEKK